MNSFLQMSTLTIIRQEPFKTECHRTKTIVMQDSILVECLTMYFLLNLMLVFLLHAASSLWTTNCDQWTSSSEENSLNAAKMFQSLMEFTTILEKQVNLIIRCYLC